MTTRTADMVKVVKVIQSCKTEEQFKVAERMINAFLNLYDQPGGDVPDFEPFRMARELRNELIRSKNKLF